MKIALIVLSAFGILISGYALSHYLGVTSGTLCNWSDVLSCDLVNKSAYAEVGGIPVALIGIIGYAFLAVTAFLKWQEKTIDRGMTRVLLVSSFGALLFSLYLTGIEAFILHAYCPTCLASFALILTLTVLALLLFIKERSVQP